MLFEGERGGGFEGEISKCTRKCLDFVDNQEDKVGVNNGAR